GSDAARAHQVAMTLATMTPVALLKGQPGEAPLTAKLEMTAARAETPTDTVRGLKLETSATAWDLAAARANLTTAMTLDAIEHGPGEARLHLPKMRFELGVQRRGDDFDVKHMA